MMSCFDYREQLRPQLGPYGYGLALGLKRAEFDLCLCQRFQHFTVRHCNSWLPPALLNGNNTSSREIAGMCTFMCRKDSLHGFEVGQKIVYEKSLSIV